MAMFDVTNLNDSGAGSLRQAILDANAAAGADEITFSVSGVISMDMALGQMNITDDLIINGDTDGDGKADVTIDALGVSRIFSVNTAGTDVTLESLTMENGFAAASFGGAIAATSADSLTLINSTIRNSSSGTAGGAIFSGVDLTIVNSTLSGNDAGENGGAITSTGGSLTLTNATVHGNTANGVGGGFEMFTGITATINTSTITGNQADADGASTTGGGGIAGDLALVTINNSVIAENTSGTGMIADDVNGTIGTANNSFFGTTETITTASAIINGGGDPLLGALQDNGGAVETRLIELGSALVNAGDAALLPTDTQDLDGDLDVAEALPLDANGFARINGTLDIGATEIVDLSALVVDTLVDEDDGDFSAGDLSLREALGLVAAGGTITFDAALASGSVGLTLGELEITQGVTINGDTDGDLAADITIDGAGNGGNQLFNVASGGEASFESLTFANASSNNSGGAITSSGTLSVLNASFENNSSGAAGGAIRTFSGSAVVANSTFTGNTASNSGGAIFNTAEFSILNSTFVGNTSGSAGAIATSNIGSTLDLINSTITGNRAAQNGGGVDVTGGTATIANTIIAGNSAGGSGADVDGSVASSGVNIFGSAVTGSSANDLTLDGMPGNELNDVFETVLGITVGGATFDAGVIGGNGGPTATVQILAGGLAQNAGDDASVPTEAALGLDVDGDGTIEGTAVEVAQRGEARSIKGVDIGAVEFNSTLVVDTLIDEDDGDYSVGDLSLREALAIVSSGGTITFDAALAGGMTPGVDDGRIILNGDRLIISRDVTIDGDVDGDNKADITIDANGASRVISISGGTDVNLLSLNLTGGNADRGGALRAYSGAIVDVVDSTISGNTASVRGGGLYNQGSTLNVLNSLVTGNNAPGIYDPDSYSTDGGRGGGIFGQAGTTTLINSTVSGNSAYYSGAIHNSGLNGGSTLEITNSTIVGGITAYGTENATNSIIAGSIYGGLNGNTNSLLVANAGAAGLAALADNGGSVMTRTLLEGSAAINAGNAALLPADTFDLDGDMDTAEALPVDANGNVRTVLALDIGAVESQTLVVDTLVDESDGDFSAGDLSLREALAQAPEGGTIRFDAALAGQTINVGSGLGELDIIQGVTLNGDIDGDGKADITISGNDLSRVFDIGGLGTEATLRSLTITDGAAQGGDRGGAIFAGANTTLNVINSTVRNSAATGDEGGGIFTYGGTLSVVNSTLSGNSARSGGGIYASGGSDITVINSTFNANNVVDGGGAIAAGSVGGSATVDILNSTIVGNDAAGLSGGGLFLYNGSSATVNNSIIARNTGASDADVGNIASTIGANNSIFTQMVTLNSGANNALDAGGALVGALADNGGPVQTMALEAGSGAIGMGDAALLPADTFDLDTDGDTTEALPLGANGFARVDGGALDIGAAEFIDVSTLVVDSPDDVVNGDFSAGDLSLREAIGLVSAGGTITFDAALSGGIYALNSTLTIASGFDATIDADLDDDGNVDITLQGPDNFTLLDVANGATAEIDGLGLTGGRGEGYTASDPSAYGLAGGDAGGAITNAGTLTLRNSVISGNTAIGGDGYYGGMYTGAGGTGGAAAGGILNSGTLTLIDTALDGNTATGGSGGNGGSGMEAANPVPASDGYNGGRGGDAAGSILNLGGGILSLVGAALGSSTTSGGAGGGGGSGGAGYYDMAMMMTYDPGNGGVGGAGGDTSAHILNLGSITGQALIAGAVANTAGIGGYGGNGGVGDMAPDGNPGAPGAPGSAGVLVVSKGGTGNLDLVIEAESTGITDGQNGDDVIAGDGTVALDIPYGGAAAILTKDGTTGNDSLANALVLGQGDFGFGSDPNVDNGIADTSAYLTINATGSDAIDFYRFTVETRGEVVIDIDNNSFDTELRLFDAAGNFVAENDDNDGLASLIDITLDAGDYVVQAFQFNEAAINVGQTYDLHITLPTRVPNFAFGSGNIDTLNGGAGNDSLYGFLDNDTLNGGDDDDRLFGDQGADTLNGDNGDDILDGGFGIDTMTGGQGNDVFVYKRDSASDTVTDFGATYFTINLDGTQEVPPNASTATGVGSAVLNQTQTELDIEFTLTGLDLDGTQTAPTADNVVASHIHDGDAGANGPVVFNILTGAATDPVAGTVENTWTGIDAANATNLLADGAYVNVHTTGISSGEIRGQILTAGADTDRIDVSAIGVGALSELLPFFSEAGGDTTLTTRINGSASSLVLSGVALASLSDANFIFGGAGSQNIHGTAGADDLFGGADDDTISGDTGADTMVGGTGNDTYFVDDAGDVVLEGVGAGTLDVIFSEVSYTIAANAERLLLQGMADIDATGLDGQNDILFGNSGNNALDGKGGIDTLLGGLGNDRYFVDNINDSVVEAAGAGTDFIFSSISNTLAANTERLILTGMANIDATGLDGRNDILIGNTGDNILDGKSGIDTLIGGLGNDRYIIDNAADIVRENAGEGIGDYIFSSVSYTNAANAERLYLTGTENINATGLDGQADLLVGNSGNNTLDGKSGRDIMQGQGGNDVYFVDQLTDIVTENAGEGTDFIFTTGSYQIAENAERLIAVEGANAVGLTARNFQNDIIIGNSGTNVFVDQFGRDIFVGGGGADFFRFIANLDPVNNVNRINDFDSTDDQFQLQQTIYSQIDVGILDASEFVLGTAAGDADDRIIYDSSVGKAYYDPDGTGAAAQIEIVNVTIGTVITADDFQIF